MSIQKKRVDHAESAEDRAARAVSDAMPKPGESVDHALFRLARSLRGIPSLDNAPAEQLGKLFATWLYSVAGASGFEGDTYDEWWRKFRRALRGVKFPGSDGSPVEAALEAARGQPPKAALFYRSDAVRLLASLCFHLAGCKQGGTFYLAARTAATATGMTPRTALDWLYCFCNDGLLELLEKGRKQTGKAGQYRWVASADVAPGAKPAEKPPTVNPPTEETDDEVPF